VITDQFDVVADHIICLSPISHSTSSMIGISKASLTVTVYISGTDRDIQNRTSTRSTVISPTFGEKSLVNFGVVTTKIWRSNCTHPKHLLLEDYISAPKGCCTSKFLHALENDQISLTLGTGVSLTIIFKGGVKLA